MDRDEGRHGGKNGGKFLMNVMSIYLKRTSPRSTLSLAERRRRRRISITAGEESEANVTCGFTERQ